MWSGGITGFTNIATRLLRSTIRCVLGHMTIMLDKMHGIIVFPQNRLTKEEVISYQDLTVPSHMYSFLTNTSVIRSAAMLMREEQLPSSDLSTDEWDCMGGFSSANTRTIIEADVKEQISPINHTCIFMHIHVASGKRTIGNIISGGSSHGQLARGADKTAFLRIMAE